MPCAFLLLSDDPVCFTLKIPMTPCTRTTAKYSRSPRSTWHGRKAAENIAQQINGWEWFHRDVPFFIRKPPSPYNKGWRVFEVGFGIFSSKKGTKFDPLDTIFSKMLTKNEPFDFHCLKGADKNLRVHIPVILSGAGSTVGVLTLNGTSPTHPLINLQPKHLDYILKLRKKVFIILRRADVLAGTSSSSQSSSFLLLFLLSVAGRSSYRLIPPELEVSPPLAEKYKKNYYFEHLKKLRQEVDSIFCITRWRKIAKQVVHFDFLWSSTWLVSGLLTVKFPGCISPYPKQNGGSWAIDLLFTYKFELALSFWQHCEKSG